MYQNTISEHAYVMIFIAVISIIFCIFLYKTKYNYLFGIIYLFVGEAVCYSLALSPSGYTWGRSFLAE